MAQMRTMKCPQCTRENQPFVAVEGIEEYRCHSCGLVYYGPCGCDTSEEPMSGTPRQELGDDWRMTPAVPPVESAAHSETHPGGC